MIDGTTDRMLIPPLLPGLRRLRLERWAAPLALAVVPLGIYGPWEPVWLVPIVLGLAVVAAAGIDRSTAIDLGLFAGFTAFAAATVPWSLDRRAGAGMVFAFAAAGAMYLIGRRSAGDPGAVRNARRVATSWVGLLAAGLVLQDLTGEFPNGIVYDYPVRHAAMAAVPLLAIAFASRRGHRLAILVGAAAVVGALATGSRTASVVLLVVLVAAAAPRVSLRTRLMGALALVAAIAVAVTVPSIQQRWFGEVIEDPFRNLDQLTVETGGRPAVWADVAARCTPNRLVGAGLGTANRLASRHHPGFPDPHNEFLRFACDTGVAGSALLWSFFGFAAIRSLALLRRRPDHRIAWSTLLSLAALVAFSLVWNPVTAVEFTGPLMLTLGWADHAHRHVSDKSSAPVA